ncbi:calcium-translocating P-type ATPase, PMCA-type [Methylovulum miyakonense]|uniref:calcium-translocating P-type ATPase, PMCA-type n=1 Tax=Methylovulum miyakonense TaxID=645578 RepID=UPI00037EB0D8|nr:calcium-translocating P-type ATPase, PMCA-type [Methylovulum miyakonense]
MNDFLGTTPTRYLIPAVFLTALLLLSYRVLNEFMVSIVWAFIIAYVTWPLYSRLRHQLKGKANLSAGVMTAIITAVIFSIIFWLVAVLQDEVRMAYQTLVSSYGQQPYHLPAAIKKIPWLENYLQPWVERLNHDRTGLITQIAESAKQWLGHFAQFLGGIGQYVMNFGFTLVTLFFCFRDGDAAVSQLRRGVIHFLGEYQNVYLQAVGDTTRAVVYGLVLAAMGQGFLAGIGYVVAGVEAPVLFGVITALLAIVPMGAMAVWIPIGVSLLLSDQWVAGIGLLVWGVVAVSTVDNVIRPLVISGTSQVPFLVVMFGVFGGLTAFGPVGLFLGPVILSVLLSVWRAWLKLLADGPITAPAAVAPVGGHDWHSLSIEETLHGQATDLAQGLSQTEAESRLQRVGFNRLAEKPPRPAWHLLLSQFKSFLIVVLVAAAILAATIGDIMDGVVIMVVVVINALLGFYQEFQAEQSLSALKKMLTLQAKVRRGGKIVELPAEQLVPGDIVVLEAGNKIPADGRVVLARTLEVDESSLTGESLPVDKQEQALATKAVPLAERTNMLYMNNAVTRGRAEMVVTATGMGTEIGKLADLLSQTEEGETPLQIQLGSVGKRLALIALGVVAIVFAGALWRGEPLADAAFTAIALAVAAIPEGLPAVVTVTLALGMHRMAKQQAIVKRLAAVETLGCTTVICTDKTGTLTVNQMTARAVFYKGQNYHVSGEGYQTVGEILPSDAKTALPDLQDLLLPLALCNDSELQGHKIIGDPMEGALLVLAAKGGMDKQQACGQWPRLAEIPFDAEHKFMATFHRHGEGITVFVKGAPEVLLALCDSVLDEKGQPSGIDKTALHQQNADMAGTGLRVLGVAVARLELGQEAQVLAGDLFHYVQKLTFVALVGLMDPPRAEAKQAIALCQKAGIAVKMITGDQTITAAAIAKELGLVGEVVNGTELAAMDDDVLAACINGIAVFARTSPEQKVRIINALKLAGHIVAMTGDGVNDAPALKNADLGIAMGISGTDVAQEAAAMILADDNFATIVKAVKEGRGIYDNMIKFVRFQLSTNIGAILTVISAPLLGMPVPFTAVQLLWINIIMDGPPAMSLGVDPISPHSMDKMPRDPEARILSWRRFGNLLCYGLTMAVGTLGILYYGLQTGTSGYATTWAFNTFVLFQIFNVFNARSEHGSTFASHFCANRWFWLAIGSVLLLQLLIINWPPAEAIFHTTALKPADWLIATGVAASVLVFEELRKLLFRRPLSA